MRIALGIAYDGAPFAGWQSQPAGNTVQDRLEAAVAAVAERPVRLTAAGRTDAGVHATAQVAHFDVDVARPESAWVRGTNSSLPQAIAVQWATEVDGEFHARYSAASRTYRYVLYNHAVRPSVLAGKVGWFHLPLDVERMRTAARALVGRHDFSAFRSAECQAQTPVRELSGADVERRGDYVLFELSANAFLHHMVRNVVGMPGARRQGRGAARVAGGGAREPGSEPRRRDVRSRRALPHRGHLSAAVEPPGIPAYARVHRNGAMRTRVKICGITSPEHGTAAARQGADAIGLIFYPPSPRLVTIERAREIAAAVPPFVARVAVFVNASVAEVEAVVRGCRPDLLQFHGEETPEFCARIRPAVPARGAGETGGRFARIPVAFSRRRGAGCSTPTGTTVRRHGRSLRLGAGSAAPRPTGGALGRARRRERGRGDRPGAAVGRRRLERRRVGEGHQGRSG